MSTSGSNTTADASITNNTITNSNDVAVEVDLDDDGTICIDFIGDTVTENLELDENGSGAINVEQLDAGDGDPLNTLNTFNNGAVVDEQTGTINSVADGFCAIP